MNLDRVIAVGNNKTVYRDGGRCLKVFGEEYSKADVLSAALNQARLEEAGLNIPKILEVTEIDGKWAIVSEFIEGTTLAELMETYPERKSEYVELLVDLQMQIHAKTAPKLSRLKDKLGVQIAQTDLDATTRYDLHARLEAMPKHAKLCHGDFTPSNIIIAEDGTPYIIDWSHATQGNASADAARTYLLLWMAGDITGAECYLDLYCDKCRVPKDYIRKWMPIIAAAQTLTDTEREREFLLSWIGVSEYQLF